MFGEVGYQGCPGVCAGCPFREAWSPSPIVFQASCFVVVGGVEISHAFGLAGWGCFMAVAREYSHRVALVSFEQSGRSPPLDMVAPVFM